MLCVLFKKLACLAGYFFQHFQTDFASGNFAQSGDARFVFAFNFGRVALSQHTGPVSGSQHQLETVGDLFETVLNGNACHGGVLRFNQMRFKA